MADTKNQAAGIGFGLPPVVTIRKKGEKYVCRSLLVAEAFGLGPDFAMWNGSDKDAEVDFLRPDLVLDENGRPIQTLPLRSFAPPRRLKVNTENTSLKGTYAFKVLMADGQEAEGGSRPDVEIVR
jgi:hypothetical protein